MVSTSSVANAWWDPTYNVRNQILNLSTLYTNTPFSVNGSVIWTVNDGTCKLPMYNYTITSTGTIAIANDSVQCNWINTSSLTGNNPTNVFINPTALSYSFENVVNNHYNDSTPNKLDLNLSNFAGVQTRGVIGQGVLTIPTSDYMVPSFTHPSAWAYEFWLNDTSASCNGDPWCRIISWEPANTIIFARHTTNGFWSIFTPSAWTDSSVSTGADTGYNLWYINYSSDRTDFYRNGIYQGTVSKTLSPSGGTAYHIPNNDNRGFIGSIDEFRFYNTSTALTVNQMLMDYQNGKGNLTTLGIQENGSDTTPPIIIIQSPLNQTYATNSIWFNITLNEVGSWVEYSLDGTANVTMANSSGNWNALVSPISEGSHSIKFYANDTSGNMNISSITYFTVDTISPSLVSYTPSVGAVGVDTNTTITLVFSEDMNQSTFSGVTLKDLSNNSINISLQSYNSTTYTAIFGPSAILASNTGYTATLSGLKDLAGNALPDKSWSFTTATSYNITSSKNGANGWNLISLPVAPTNTAPASVLSNVINNIVVVWTYESATNWTMYAPGDPSSDLTQMTAGYAYWINYNNSVSKAITGSGTMLAEGANTPPQRTLTSGWNLIGYYGRENTNAIASKCALFTLTPDINDATAKWWSLVFGYDNQDKQPTQVGYTANMTSGQGYWIFMTSKLSTYLYGPGLSSSECA